MMLKFGPVLFVLFGNVWIWKIFIGNAVAGITALTCAFFLIFSFNKKHIFPVFILSLFILVVMQHVTTEKRSLTNLDNDEQRLQSQRIKEYPPTYLSLFGKTLWFYPSEIERNGFFIAFSRMQKDLFENLDPNQYFFSGHPRQRVEVKEFEKFPYIFLPFFIGGIYYATKKGCKVFLAAIPLLILLSIIGNKNNSGPFVLFPFFSAFVYLGLRQFLEFVPAKIFGIKDLLILKILNASFWAVIGVFVFQSFVYEFLI